MNTPQPFTAGRTHDTGFRFGPGNFIGARSKPETNTNRTVPGVSIADVGFELLAHDGTFASWFLCPLDAVDAMKVFAGACKIVRCADRALIKRRYPRSKR